MKFSQALRQIMKEKNITQTALAEQLGINQSAFAMKLKRDNISLKTFIKIMDLLGYDVVIQPSKTGIRLVGQIPITEDSTIDKA